jgi:hypothetical protein
VLTFKVPVEHTVEFWERRSMLQHIQSDMTNTGESSTWWLAEAMWHKHDLHRVFYMLKGWSMQARVSQFC